MDIPITKKPAARSRRLRFLTVAATCLAVFVVIVVVLVRNSGATEDLVWVEVRVGDIEQTSPGTGRFISTRQRVITAVEAGIVETIAKSVGDAISEGDILLTLDGPELINSLSSAEIEVRREQLQSMERLDASRRELARAEIELASTKITLETARAENEMNAELFETNVVSRLEYARSRNRMRESEMRLEGAELELASAYEHVERQQIVHDETLRLGELRLQQLQQRKKALIIRAPSAGVVKRLDLRLGDNVSAGQAIAEIGPQAPDGARLRFPQRDLDQLVPGVPVELRFMNRTVGTRIVRVSPDLIDGMVVAEVKADALPENARIDMAVRGDARMGTLEGVLHARLPAMPAADGTLEAWLERNGARQRVVLQNVQSIAGNLVFSSGVQSGDRIAIADGRTS